MRVLIACYTSATPKMLSAIGRLKSLKSMSIESAKKAPWLASRPTAPRSSTVG